MEVNILEYLCDRLTAEGEHEAASHVFELLLKGKDNSSLEFGEYIRTSTLLNRSFVWDSTPQGYDYWNRLSDKLREKEMGKWHW